MSQSGYRRLTPSSRVNFRCGWCVPGRSSWDWIMSSTLSLFSSVHAVLGLSLPDCLEVEPVSSIFSTSLLMLCLDHFFPGNSFTILAPRQPFSLKHASITALSLSLNTIFSHEQKDLVCQNEIPVPLFKANCIPHVILECDTLASWHLDILTSNIWQPIPVAPDCLVPWINDIAESDLQFSMTSHFMAIWCTVMKRIPPIDIITL